MIKITKEERNYLISKGVPCKDDGISRTLKGKYLLCESDVNLALLEKYRESVTVMSRTN